MKEPFAVLLYRRYEAGETVQQLAEELGIPGERVEQRIRAAVLYTERQKTEAGLRRLERALSK
jgi:hypothetical protein